MGDSIIQTVDLSASLIPANEPGPVFLNAGPYLLDPFGPNVPPASPVSPVAPLSLPVPVSSVAGPGASPGPVPDPIGQVTPAGQTGSGLTYGNPNGGDTFLLTHGNTQLVLFGSNDKVILDGGTADIYDHAQGLEIDVAGPLTGNVYLIGASPESAPVIDLLGGVGGFATADQAYAALTSDGHGGSLLQLGGGAIDILGISSHNLSAANFHIG